ncbi:protoplast secreted protein 2 precursor [Basidiobolus meristosporus CBS 931.73]|uniref:Protoplast secreted protein 2 n=1 Tax=Basidiobolus meristosporus CBS 931.73 TaxID=1314790 RepID=A0A1Y1VWG1_9FUNG|nr:protoplast secreted protein 2 precursor [Basidiobolus meristosporus CBS 931.73]ORY03721.1 protoplast secreted protein 2 precursor [Basidiobolus meristosporus CBS 931.73]|eukprot:ORX65326.1 protoplast secreted protein 2 precursor [Basidiobolus meristosporus CBS 931.73]
MVKIYIIIHTVYHHIYQLALAIKEGVEKVPGVEVSLFQVPETLSEEVLAKMHAPPKPDIPVITPAQLEEADGFIFGIPTRYGTQPGQWRAFWDATGSLWARGALAKKFATTFFSTASQHGGQETTALTSLTTLAHHGIIYVPLGYTSPHLTDNSEVLGGSAYGAGTIAGGDGSRKPSAKELEVANHQGEYFAKIVQQYVRGAQ